LTQQLFFPPEAIGRKHGKKKKACSAAERSSNWILNYEAYTSYKFSSAFRFNIQ
jgi:hypothetical protein